MVGLSHYLILGALMFAISVIGIFLNRKNVIILLMAIELMLLAVNLNFIAFFALPERHRWSGVRIFYPDGGCRRIRDWSGDSGRAVP